MKGNKIKTTHHNPRSKATLLLGLILLTACSTNDIYNKQNNIPADGWDIYNTQTFDIDIATTSHYDIDLFLRHDNQYKYRNLWLFVDHIAPDSTISTDTINIELADNYGHWLGGGWGSTHQLEQNYLTHQLLDSGRHTIKLTQAMREYKLKEIKNIGLSVTKSEE